MKDPTVLQLLAALAELPTNPSVSYRGLPDGVAVPTAAFKLQELLPTSRHLGVATEGWQHHRVLVLLGRDGRDLGPLSARPGDGEVVFLPGGIFAPVARVAVPVPQVKDLDVVVVEEVALDAAGTALPRPSQWPAGLAAVVQHLLADGRTPGTASEPAAVGRFAGPVR